MSRQFCSGIRRNIGFAALAMVLPIMLLGCSGAQPSAGAVAVPATVTVTAIPSTDTPRLPTEPSSTDSTAPSNEPTSSTGPSILGPEASGRSLTLDDFFNADPSWNGNRFDIADRHQVQGIANQVALCSHDSALKLELRLADNFKTLNFEVGQDNNSTSSDQTLTVEVMGNNKQIDIQKISFNQVKKMSISVDNVNALQILFYLDNDSKLDCGTSTITAVMSNAILS